MKDYLVKIMAKEAGVRAFAVITTETADEARRRHETTPTATYVLAKALTASALMGALLKVQQRVALKFEGTGPLQKTITESDSYGNVRGYVANPDVDLPKLEDGSFDVVSAIGQAGLLTVVRDLKLKQLYEGVVHLEKSDIDADLTYYMNQSEQIPTHIETAVLLNEAGEVTVAGGILIQELPSKEGANAVAQVQEKLQELPPLTQLLQDGKTPEDLLALTFADIAYEELEKRPIQFKCTCSRERTEQALLAIGADELRDLINNVGEAAIECHFCHEQYYFDKDELTWLLEEIEDKAE